jgi:hypothetical protein
LVQLAGDRNENLLTLLTAHPALTYARLPGRMGLVLVKSQGKFGLFDWMVTQVS